MNTAMNLVKQPAILPLYLACLLKKAQPQSQENAINNLTLTFNDCHIDSKKLEKYNVFYGRKSQKETVTASYIHLLVFRPQLKFLLNKALPFPVMGLVHMFNDIILHKRILVNDKIDIKISVKDFHQGKKGKELTLHTEVIRQGELVWESFSGYLYPSKKKHQKSSVNPVAKTPVDSDVKSIWNLPSNLGRRFALLSGDANPIHTYKLAAKLFGFKQAIAHGMCMALKCEHELAKLRHDSSPLRRLYVEFKKPIYLPNSVIFKANNLDQPSIDFLVDSNDKQSTTMIKGFAAY